MRVFQSFRNRHSAVAGGALMFFAVLSLQAQQPATPPLVAPPQNPQAGGAQQPFTISVRTQLVIETVVVKDGDGKVIDDLTQKDFVVTEDGVPQTISVFEFQKIEDDLIPSQPSPAPPAVPATPAAVPQPVNTISPERAGDVKYRDRRLIALYFEMTSMPDADKYRTLGAAQQFISTQMRTADMLAVMAHTGGAVKVLQDFTDNRDLLQTALVKLLGEDESDDSGIVDAGTPFGQDDGEFNLFNTDRQLAALQTAVNMLRSLSEQKTLVYFASGLMLNGVNNQAQMHATINAAARANVAFFPVDARGLVARPPMGDASMSAPGGVAMFNGAAGRMGADRFQRSQDTLYALAADTGGKALIDSNDLSAGIVEAQKAFSSYYIIGYYTTNTNLDGKFRRVKISLKEIPAKLTYRQGYFAGKEFSKFTAADKERQLEEALMLGDPITDLTIAMELNYFRLNQAEYFVPLTVKIPGSELALAKRGGAEHTVIDFIGEVKDDYGTTIQNVRDKVDIKLSDATAAQLVKSPIQYDTGFTLLPGKYIIKFLARDAETGRIGTYQAPFLVPNLNKELQKVPISSVVLGSQRMDLKEALYNARKDTVHAVNPLVENNQKLIPSVTRVFSKSRDMYVYLQAYELNATSTEPLVAFVTLYRGQAKAFETSPIAVTEGLDPKSKTLPLRFSVPLDQLTPGQYTCQITVLDPNAQKAAFWQAPIMLIP
jgi:VWFA-related protein